MPSSQFLRYVMVGLLNTAIGYCTILLLRYGFGWHDLASNATGYAIGACCSYALNRHFTFKSTRGHQQTVPMFVMAMGLCYGLNAAALFAGLHWLGLPSFAAQAMAMVVYTVSFFFLSRSVVFRDSVRPSDEMA